MSIAVVGDASQEHAVLVQAEEDASFGQKTLEGLYGVNDHTPISGLLKLAVRAGNIKKHRTSLHLF